MGWGHSRKAGRNGKAKGAEAAPLACPLPLISALEPRMMFDGAVAATVADTAASAATSAPTAADAAHDTGASDSSHAGTADNSHGTQDLQASPVTDGQNGVRKEIVFVDTRAPNYQELLKAVSPNAEVVLLSTNKDGVQQIADALAGRTGIDAIHIISHGDSGVLLLGNGPLFEGNLGQYASQLSSIGKALTTDGDILLYGCEVGAGSEGQAFVTKLAGMTGADIAASDDNTGGNAKGGDWDLEIATGQIAASSALSLSRLGGYDHLLVTTAVNNIADLKSAIATGNTDGVDDVITLTGNITFASFNDAITINVTDGHTLQIVGGGFALDGANKTRVLDVTTSGANSKVALDNITIRNGLLVGNGANEGAPAMDSLGAAIRNAGVLTITNSTITANKASGGGGGGGDFGGNYAGGGGGGGGFGTTLGGTGGTSAGAAITPTSPSTVTGGNGGGPNPDFGGVAAALRQVRVAVTSVTVRTLPATPPGDRAGWPTTAASASAAAAVVVAHRRPAAGGLLPQAASTTPAAAS
ncbi:hypothetical protein PSm6_04680 [Pseudomonas solani]|uniref:DUF4347 domain-containing protein n=1 Tax=Pseudomonas solani TaxID=2731552 RepID=A0ABN6BNY7_9PSED|nr:DUF4347 domain-containing protein [Pseudomonas solani]BCD84061.1 hypothetical protein PSm6_04680 [Pseudomonas solani]